MEDLKNEFQELDSGIEANGILEVMPDGFGFIHVVKTSCRVKMTSMWQPSQSAVLI